MSKSDVKILKRGLRHLGMSLIIAILTAGAVISFIDTAKAHGYLAVLAFLAGVIQLGWAFIMLYAQGITCTTFSETRGERK